MDRALIVALTAFTLAAAPIVAQSAPAEDEAGVRAALQHYLNGHATVTRKSSARRFIPTRA